MKISNARRLSIITAVCITSIHTSFVTYSADKDIVYDSYHNLVMAGYQGWFNTPGDGADLGWRHYGGRNGFQPGSCSVDMWPEVSEYPITYSTSFTFENGETATTFSSHDQSTTDTHFRWMQEYGIDGVFMQRFISDVKRPKIKAHFDHVLNNAMEAALKYDRAISVMYDLSGMRSEDVDFLINDLSELDKKHNLHHRDKNPSYLYHNGKPLVAIWGVGFNDGRAYSIKDASKIVRALKEKGYSIMLGVPTYWREFGEDTENDIQLHDVIKECDIVMPWFVGRYNEPGFKQFKHIVKDDIEWCETNGVDYAPLCYPGFSWANMKGKDSLFIPRNHGKFFKKQIDNAIKSGAKMLYIAMFDEIDEGTAIFKCASRVPEGTEGSTFQAIEKASESDLYLRIAGEASKRLKSKQ